MGTEIVRWVTSVGLPTRDRPENGAEDTVAVKRTRSTSLPGNQRALDRRSEAHAPACSRRDGWPYWSTLLPRVRRATSVLCREQNSLPLYTESRVPQSGSAQTRPDENFRGGRSWSLSALTLVVMLVSVRTCI
jgi:hypothetical protein